MLGSAFEIEAKHIAGLISEKGVCSPLSLVARSRADVVFAMPVGPAFATCSKSVAPACQRRPPRDLVDLRPRYSFDPVPRPGPSEFPRGTPRRGRDSPTEYPRGTPRRGRDSPTEYPRGIRGGAATLPQNIHVV